MVKLTDEIVQRAWKIPKTWLLGRHLKGIISCNGRFLHMKTSLKKEDVAEHSCFVLLSGTNIHHSDGDLYIKMKNVPKVLCQDLLPFWAPDNAAERCQMPMTDIPTSINIWTPAAPARLVGCPLYRNVLAIQPSGDLWTDKSLCVSKSSLFIHSCYLNFGVIITSAFSSRNFKLNTLNY